MGQGSLGAQEGLMLQDRPQLGTARASKPSDLHWPRRGQMSSGSLLGPTVREAGAQKPGAVPWAGAKRPRESKKGGG